MDVSYAVFLNGRKHSKTEVDEFHHLQRLLLGSLQHMRRGIVEQQEEKTRGHLSKRLKDVISTVLRFHNEQSLQRLRLKAKADLQASRSKKDKLKLIEVEQHERIVLEMIQSNTFRDMIATRPRTKALGKAKAMIKQPTEGPPDMQHVHECSQALSCAIRDVLSIGVSDPFKDFRRSLLQPGVPRSRGHRSYNPYRQQRRKIRKCVRPDFELPDHQHENVVHSPLALPYELPHSPQPSSPEVQHVHETTPNLPEERECRLGISHQQQLERQEIEAFAFLAVGNTWSARQYELPPSVPLPSSLLEAHQPCGVDVLQRVGRMHLSNRVLYSEYVTNGIVINPSLPPSIPLPRPPMPRRRAALKIQRCYRGYRGRCKFARKTGGVCRHMLYSRGTAVEVCDKASSLYQFRCVVEGFRAVSYFVLRYEGSVVTVHNGAMRPVLLETNWHGGHVGLSTIVNAASDNCQPHPSLLKASLADRSVQQALSNMPKHPFNGMQLLLRSLPRLPHGRYPGLVAMLNIISADDKLFVRRMLTSTEIDKKQLKTYWAMLGKYTDCDSLKQRNLRTAGLMSIQMRGGRYLMYRYYFLLMLYASRCHRGRLDDVQAAMLCVRNMRVLRERFFRRLSLNAVLQQRVHKLQGVAQRLLVRNELRHLSLTFNKLLGCTIHDTEVLETAFYTAQLANWVVSRKGLNMSQSVLEHNRKPAPSLKKPSTDSLSRLLPVVRDHEILPRDEFLKKIARHRVQENVDNAMKDEMFRLTVTLEKTSRSQPDPVKVEAARRQRIFRRHLVSERGKEEAMHRKIAAEKRKYWDSLNGPYARAPVFPLVSR